MKKLLFLFLCLTVQAQIGFSQTAIIPHTTPQTKTVLVPPSTQISSFVGDDIIRITNSGKAAYINVKGETLFGFDFGILEDGTQNNGNFSGGVAAARLGYGKPMLILNHEGKYMELPDVYKNISDFVDGVSMTQKVPQGGKGSIVYINGIGKDIFPVVSRIGPYTPSPFEVRALREGLRPFNDPTNRLWGYHDEQGKIVIQPKFYNALPFSEGMAAVALQKEGILQWGFIDKKGNTVIEPAYKEFPGFFREGLCPVIIGAAYENEMAYIDKTGKIVSQKFYACNAFYDGYAIVQTGYNKSAVIDKKFNVLSEIKDEFKLLSNKKTMKLGIEFYDGLAAIGKDNRNELFGKIIRPDGTVAYETSAEMRYGELGNFYDGKHAYISYREKEGNRLVRGFINRTGEIVIIFVEEANAKIVATVAPRKGTWTLGSKIVIQETKEYELKLDVEPVDAGKLFGAGKYSEKTKVDINTVSNNKTLYAFIGWRDNSNNKIVETTTAYSIASIGKNEHFTAVYKKLQAYDVVATSNNEKLGSVSGGGTFVPGQKVELKAKIVGNDKNIKFKGWFVSGKLVAFSTQYKFDMPANDVKIEGRFVIDSSTPPFFKPYLVLTCDLDGAVLTGSGFYDEGTQVSVSASAPEGNDFIGWFEGNEKISDSEKFTYQMPDFNVMLRAKYKGKTGTSSPEEPGNTDEEIKKLFSHWYVCTYKFSDKKVPLQNGREIKMTATGFLGFNSDTRKIECPYPDDFIGVLALDLGKKRVEVTNGDLLQQAGFYPWIIYEITDKEIVMASGAYIFGLEMFDADVPLTHIHRVPYVVNRDANGKIISIVIKDFNPTLKADAPFIDIIFYPILIDEAMPINWHLRPEVTYGLFKIEDYEEEKALILDFIWLDIIPKVKAKLKK